MLFRSVSVDIEKSSDRDLINTVEQYPRLLNDFTKEEKTGKVSSVFSNVLLPFEFISDVRKARKAGKASAKR